VVTVDGSPARASVRVIELSTSPLPIHTVTNVGRAAAAASSCVCPPRNSVVSVFPLLAGVRLEMTSTTSAPGTDTLWIGKSSASRRRSAHGTRLLVRLCVKTFT
jgi:hypothetical protein